MEKVGDDFFQSAIHSSRAGEQRTTSRIDLVYGSAPHDEIYFSWRGDRLYELPVAWLHPQGQWGASLFDPFSGGDFSREETVRCLECHNTWTDNVPGTRNQYRRDDLILGVMCERCHGPGREHVEYHKAHPLERAAKFVVHPGKLSRERRMDLCAQCHSNATKHVAPPFSYRPGEPLDRSYKTLLTKRAEDDHVANQVQYLRQSKCFQKSGSLTCVTCHDPHRRKPEQPVGAAAPDRLCVNCHQPADCGERERLPIGVQNKCVGCHMPARNKIQVFFATETDNYLSPVKAYEHRIAVYPVAQQEILWAWFREQSDDKSQEQAARLATALATHWVRQAEQLRGEYRFLAAIDGYRQALRFDAAPATKASLQEVLKTQSDIDENWFLALHQISERQYSEAIATLKSILEIKPDLAKVHGKLGTLYATAGLRDLAVKHLEKVRQYDPDDPYGEGMLGWLDYLAGNFAQAIEHYRQADEIEPYHAKIPYQMGLAFAKLDRWIDAGDCFRKVVAIEPNHADGCEALSQSLSHQSQFPEALEYALRAAEITNRQNPGILLTLAEAYANSKRFQEADATAELAMRSAKAAGNTSLLPRIQQRKNDFRNRAQNKSM